ncbi:MAG: hypothetical protein AMXMBFR47_35560 [Planctomycetota bacterium]
MNALSDEVFTPELSARPALAARGGARLAALAAYWRVLAGIVNQTSGALRSTAAITFESIARSIDPINQSVGGRG